MSNLVPELYRPFKYLTADIKQSPLNAGWVYQIEIYERIVYLYWPTSDI